MKFHDKLTMLMDITKTTNQQLALCSSLDSSYISRLKTGGRSPVKNASYIEDFSQFFSRHIRTPAQRDVVVHLLGLEPGSTMDSARLAEAIYNWLLIDSSKKTILTDELTYTIPNATTNIEKIDRKHSIHCSCSMYLKDEGKCLAALDFFQMVAKEKTPRTLLLFTDEDLAWATRDDKFIEDLFQLIKTSLSNGNKIKIIHDFSRGPQEVLENIKAWMPLYITGCIEPYYYPKVRDGVFRTTLFVAPGLCAMSSNSVEDLSGSIRDSTTFLFTKKEAVASMEKQYEQYLDLCKPLMSILTITDPSIYFDISCDLLNRSGTTIMKTSSLSAVSMKNDILESILQRNPQEDVHEVMGSHKKRQATLKTLLMKYPVREILSIPSKDAFNKGEVLVDHLAGLDDLGIYYTREEYVQHLQNMVHLLEEYDNYHVYIDEVANDLGCSICAKEGHGMIMLKTTPPFVFLSVPSNDLFTVFWNYLMEIMHYEEPDKDIAIERIKKAIEDLSLLD